MRIKPGFIARVDEEGRLILPEGLAFEYGLAPGAEVYVDRGRRGLSFHPCVDHLAKIYIEPTNRCNLLCKTCIRHSWDEDLGQMADETFSRIMTGLSNLDRPPVVFFGGFGEPLAHPAIAEMVKRASDRGCRVELITNGTLLDQKMSEQLISAGLDMLWISLDGATPESYSDVRLGAALPEVLSNLRTFARLRGPIGSGSFCSDQPFVYAPFPKPEIGIVFVAMRRNLADLPRVVLLGRILGATRIMVTNVLPYTPEMCNESLYGRALCDQASTLNPFYRLELPKINLDQDTIATLFLKTPAGHSISFAGAQHGESVNRCPFVDQGSAAITWDGSLSPCLPLMHSHSSFPNHYERASQRHLIGNVNERTLGDLWHDREYVDFRDRVQRFDFSPCAYCGGCDLSEKNEEDCVGNTFPTCGGCLWAQGIVQCP